VHRRWRPVPRISVFDAVKGLIMGFFSNILEKLGMKEAAAAPVITPPTVAAAPAAAAAPAPVAAAPAEPVVNSITMVDVVALLTEKAAANPEKLNWKTSIVDLLKLLGLDSSLAARKELAKELYCPEEKMADSAQMNMWLHKNVLAHIAANGGNIPKELL
jgi:3-oxoacyl-ACP reductase-like protein